MHSCTIQVLRKNYSHPTSQIETAGNSSSAQSAHKTRGDESRLSYEDFRGAFLRLELATLRLG